MFNTNFLILSSTWQISIKVCLSYNNASGWEELSQVLLAGKTFPPARFSSFTNEFCLNLILNPFIQILLARQTQQYFSSTAIFPLQVEKGTTSVVGWVISIRYRARGASARARSDEQEIPNKMASLLKMNPTTRHWKVASHNRLGTVIRDGRN